MAKKKLYEVTVTVEAEDDARVEAFVDGIGQLICRMPHDHKHVCDYRWFIVRRQLRGKEAEEAEELLPAEAALALHRRSLEQKA